MKFFHLAPDSSDRRPGPSLPFAMIYGCLSFGAVSTLAYSIWAFRLVRGQAAMYSAIAAVLIVLGGLALSPLVASPRAWRRFPACFATVFFIYAVCWCVGWFGLGRRYYGDLIGAAAGLAAMTWLLQRAFARPQGFLAMFAVLLVWHSAGYYAGELLLDAVGKRNGMLLWGVAHGLGFGAGLGYVLYQCQRRAPVAPA